jgi:hypothetical protein
MMLLAQSFALLRPPVGDTPLDRGVVGASWIGILLLALAIFVVTMLLSRPPTPPRSMPPRG